MSCGRPLCWAGRSEERLRMVALGAQLQVLRPHPVVAWRGHMSAIELTGFTKANGPLTKLISLAPDGTVKSDGSACVMTRGTAQRVRVADVGALANTIAHV